MLLVLFLSSAFYLYQIATVVIKLFSSYCILSTTDGARLVVKLVKSVFPPRQGTVACRELFEKYTRHGICRVTIPLSITAFNILFFCFLRLVNCNSCFDLDES